MDPPGVGSTLGLPLRYLGRYGARGCTRERKDTCVARAAPGPLGPVAFTGRRKHEVQGSFNPLRGVALPWPFG